MKAPTYIRALTKGILKESYDLVTGGRRQVTLLTTTHTPVKVPPEVCRFTRDPKPLTLKES